MRKTILDDAHRSKMTIHPGGDKMYMDMRRVYFSTGMKKDMAEFIARCLVCQQVKAEKKKPDGLLHPLEVHNGSGRVSRWTLLMGYRDRGRVIRDLGHGRQTY